MKKNNNPKLQILVPQYKETEDIIKPLLDSIEVQQNIDLSNDIGVIIDEDYISDLKEYAERILGVSNDILVHDLILKEGENIPVWEESEVKNG